MFTVNYICVVCSESTHFGPVSYPGPIPSFSLFVHAYYVEKMGIMLGMDNLHFKFKYIRHLPHFEHSSRIAHSMHGSATMLYSAIRAGVPYTLAKLTICYSILHFDYYSLGLSSHFHRCFPL